MLKEFALEEEVMRFDQVSNTSMSTIHRQVLDAEVVILAKMRREVTDDDLNTTKSPGLEKHFKKILVHEPSPPASFLETRGAAKVFRADAIKNDATVILQGVHRRPTTGAERPTECAEWKCYTTLAVVLLYSLYGAVRHSELILRLKNVIK